MPVLNCKGQALCRKEAKLRVPFKHLSHKLKRGTERRVEGKCSGESKKDGDSVVVAALPV